MHALFQWLRGFLPAATTASKRERLLGIGGAGLGLLCAESISRHSLGTFNPWFVAPMGASAVLLFAVPSSPLAQPWSIMGGNLVSALIGVACAKLVGHTGLAAGLAGALAIGAMFQLRCLHPPSGAVALTAVLGGPAVANLGFHFVIWPVLLNSMLLLAFALVFNNALQRRYPHRPHERANVHHTADPLPTNRLGVTHDDLAAVLKARGEVMDISEDDLEEILVAAELRAHRRHFGAVRCDEIMSRDVVAVQPDTPLRQAWQLLAEHKVAALPVVDGQRKVVGIVALHDFFVSDSTSPVLPPPQRALATDLVSKIMTERVITAQAEQAIDELVVVFSDAGLHHLPVVQDNKLVGMITQSDLLAALYKSQVAGKLPQRRTCI